MDDEVRKTAAGAVVEKHKDLMVQREDALRQRGEIERAIRNIDRGLFDCRAAGRLFGVEIEIPDDARPGVIVRPPPARAADAPRPILNPHMRSMRLPAQPSPQPAEAAQLPWDKPATPTVASTVLPVGEEPSIRDLILLYLKQAGANGEKAAVLRRRVETFLNRQIHYKTIGMSLYRLSKENPPMVTRTGQTWFLSNPWAETKNPSVGAPGSIEGR